ncbi:MAG: hypothetical protein ACI4TJ_05450 [Candidatus Cryptobacteroides sp.]
MKYFKTVLFPAAVAAMLLFAPSCSREPADCGSGFRNVSGYLPVRLLAGFDDATRTELGPDGKVSWKTGDIIRYYSEPGGPVGAATAEQDCAAAEFEVNLAPDASFLVAAYGGESLSGNTSGETFNLGGAVKARQSGKFTDAHVAVARTEDPSSGKLTFSNLTAIVKFTLERSDIALVTFSSNDLTPLHGNGVMNVAFSGGEPQASLGTSGGNSIEVNTSGGGTFYLSSLPCTLAEGFTLGCYDSEGKLLGKASTGKSLVLKKSTVINLGTIDGRITPSAPEVEYNPDLSRDGTANCYIIPAAGGYSFDATVKGSCSEAIGGTPTRAEVLWESFGTDVAPTKGDIIRDVSYSGGRVMFTATGVDGNAVIAMKDASGTILWSWHIWCCMGYEADRYSQSYLNDAGVMMDRNLGALSANPGDAAALGLLYQWGRKDPFPGSSDIAKSKVSATTVTSWPSPVESSASTGTIAFATANPTTFITSSDNNDDWMDSGDKTRWTAGGKSKSFHDPCPAGYRVPAGGDSGVWAKALGKDSWTTKTSWDVDAVGIDFSKADRKLCASGPVWYPAAGYLSSGMGALTNAGYCGFYWSATFDAEGPYLFSINYTSWARSAAVNPSAINDAACAMPVRCVKEQ